jgi:hypothetical protein
MEVFVRKLCLALAFLSFTISNPIDAQFDNTASKSIDRFPYSFSNFPWWNDADLRANLKKRIPSLGDELTLGSPTEARVRSVLTQFLEEKGIQALVQSIEPSANMLSVPRDPDAPPSSIIFSVLAPPEIIVQRLILENLPDDAVGSFNEVEFRLKGKQYSETSLWWDRQQMRERLRQLGYLASTVVLEPGPPRKVGDQYLVPLHAIITSGPKYHVAAVTANGGPLLDGRNLSPYFSLKTGDVATPYAFGRLIGSLRSVYWRAGYPDVEFNGAPVLDTAHALASYQLQVIPGPMYFLRSVKVENLPTEDEAEALKLLNLKPGDTYDALAVATLSSKLSEPGSPLKGYGVSFSPREDKQNHKIDLTLSFYKQ